MGEENVLSLSEFLNSDEADYAVVVIKGGSVRIGSLTAGQMIAHTELLESEDKAVRREAGLKLIMYSLVDKNGKRIGTPDDVTPLRDKDASVCTKILQAIFKLNGMVKPDPKGSGETVTADSPIVSPAS